MPSGERLLQLAALGTALLGAGCLPVTIEAAHSVNPVLLGPVHKLGGGKLPGGAALLHTSGSQMVSASSSTTQSGNVQTTTTTSSSSKSAATQMDLDVALASDGRLDRAFATDQVDCDGYFFFILTGMLGSTVCEIDAQEVVVAAPRLPPTDGAPAGVAAPAAAVAVAPALAPPSPPAAAAAPPSRVAGSGALDVVVTRAGRRLRGKIMVDDAREVTIRLPNDETISIPRHEVGEVAYAGGR